MLISKGSEELWPCEPALYWLQGKKPKPRLKKTHFCYVTQNSFLIKLTDEVSPSQSTFIFATKLDVNFMWRTWLFQITNQAGSAQGSLMLSQASATGTVWGARPAPSNKAFSMAETQGSPPRPPHCAKGPGNRTLRAQLCLAAPYRGNIFPFQVTGEAKTREAQARLTGKHTKLTQSQTLKQHLRC